MLLLLSDAAVAAETTRIGTDMEKDRQNEAVILLHGLVRSARSMATMGRFLETQGYAVVNQGYPSRHHPVETLSAMAIEPALEKARDAGADRIHFVTHSMGGILVRHYLSEHEIPELGRVVMIAPPSQGSEAVDRLRGLKLFEWLNGPAGKQLGTGPDSLPVRLGAANFEVGVIAGSFSINPSLSLLIPGPDDGKVSVERARLPGMKDFIVMPHSHPVVMSRPPVLYQTQHFLEQGSFDTSQTP